MHKVGPATRTEPRIAPTATSEANAAATSTNAHRQCLMQQIRDFLDALPDDNGLHGLGLPLDIHTTCTSSFTSCYDQQPT